MLFDNVEKEYKVELTLNHEVVLETELTDYSEAIHLYYELEEKLVCGVLQLLAYVYVNGKYKRTEVEEEKVV